ncbi:dynein regulatory complex subunit 7 [Megalops cyprinoides]|uniref:dynein regulatory complex subunit 7 n=1 Tax=Megalops cyprinoides TaxID=118141 RepID=UPI001864A6B6|nr:dynein regulatory complex subunit 7 [Megalops cyprinoides]
MEVLSQNDTDYRDLRDQVEEEDGRGDQQELEDNMPNINTAPSLWPPPEVGVELEMSDYPASYKENSPQENQLLDMAENFRCQYFHLYPERKPLLLCPFNECGVKKFVSTTLRPTLLSYPELYSWDGCASLVSDFLCLEPLDPPCDLSRQLFSPTWVLQTQRGNCFDFSTLLCSLLLGAGYNAYCVSGYAVKDMCLRNQCRQDCPLKVREEKVKVEEPKRPIKKYTVKPPRDLRSGFQKQQEARRQAATQAVIQKRQEEEEKLEAERERPPPDPLLGQRVHSWVLVLSGSRDVPENFFIDPLTGRSFSTSDSSFLGIESVWNHQNYWVNMQSCRFGCAEMTFDLFDTVRWECLLSGSAVELQLLISDLKIKQETEEHEEEEEEEPKDFEMPPSWVKAIQISRQDMETRCPGGKKAIQYRKAKLEKFAPYTQLDGLITRLTTFTDLECKQPNAKREWYQNRQDHLEEREVDIVSSVTLEKFRPGRSHALKTHRYVTLVPETEREMEFYSNARVDGLAKREEQPLEMTESFEDRSDFLYYRHVVFNERTEEQNPAKVHDADHRPIQKVVERFHRDRSKPASEDVAERVFLVSENRIHLTYHREDDRIVPGWRSFIKPLDVGDSQNQHSFTPDMVSTFQVDPFQKPCKNLFLYEMLVSLMEEEEKVMLRVKESETEVRTILNLRAQEESNIELQICIYNTARNEKARLHREALERMANEERLRQEEEELDFLAPFLARLNSSEILTHELAVQLRNNCLATLKQQLIDEANLIQARFEMETQKLEQKQQWYQRNQLSMTREDEEEYLTFCSDAMFKIHVLKLRLSRQKEEAPQKYLALDKKLRHDPRLVNLL